MNNTELLTYVQAEIRRWGRCGGPCRVRRRSARSHRAAHRRSPARDSPSNSTRIACNEEGVKEEALRAAATEGRESAPPVHLSGRAPISPPPAPRPAPPVPGGSGLLPSGDHTMAKKRRKKLTKAEAGRMGGKATVRKYGPEHMRRSARPVSGIRRKFGYMGGAAGAIPMAEEAGEDPRAWPTRDPGEPIFHGLWEH